MRSQSLCVFVAAVIILASGLSSVLAQATGGVPLIAAPAGPPASGQVGSERGRLLIRTSNGAVQPLIGYSNGPRDGFTDSSAPNQCTHLIVRYAGILGLGRIQSTRDVGDGKDVARNFAAASDGRFRFIDGANGTEAPVAGAVISIGNRSQDGGSWTNNPYGHVGIAQRVEATGPNRITVTLFDQNFPVPSGRWKQVIFTRAASRWTGTMSNTTSRGTQQLVVAGWANPRESAEARGLAEDTSSGSASAWTLVPAGYGPVRMGMTPGETSRALGTTLRGDPPANGSDCQELLASDHPGLEFMFHSGRLVRITAGQGSRVRTPRGIGVGSSETEVRSRYPGIIVEGHKYADRPALSMTYWLIPGSSGVRFETDEGRRVTQIHAGTAAIQLVESCL
jgi:hypothetical protein